MNICPVVPCGQAEGRTDMTQLIVAFCKFANAPKNPDIAPRIASRNTVHTILFLELYRGEMFQ